MLITFELPDEVMRTLCTFYIELNNMYTTVLKTHWLLALCYKQIGIFPFQAKSFTNTFIIKNVLAFTSVYISVSQPFLACDFQGIFNEPSATGIEKPAAFDEYSKIFKPY